MKRTFKHILYIGMIALLAGFTSCSDDVITTDKAPVTNEDGGTLLSLSVGMGNENKIESRLAELGGDKIAELINKGSGKDQKLKHIGLYIYYEDDYTKDDLSHPYIRNMRCNITGNNLTPCDAAGNALTEDKGKIYIYDRMRIVIFYPYNEAMSNETNFFKKKIDEEAYPISLSNYADQDYIPYRGEVDVNPTNAYYREIWLQPKHTAKIEIVLVSKEVSKLPVTGDFTSGDIKILPKLDPYSSTQTGGTGYSSDTREHWLDGINKHPATSSTLAGGLYAYQYVAYLWTSKKGDKHHDNDNNNYGTVGGIQGDHNHWDNNIAPGDIVFQSGNITLFSSQQVNLAEQRVYRYGYNMDTGEVFIPTSSTLIYDANSFYETGYDEDAAYQVCDIEMDKATSQNKKKSIFNATYDGGGHKITGLTISTDAAAGKQVGLFTNINGTSYIRNVNLIAPVITVTANDSCFVGGICGHINPRLTQEQIKELGKNLPEGLSETVKAELLKDLIAQMTQTTSQIISCRVEKPSITVTSPKARVGALCGAAGDRDEQGKYYAKIWDSYSVSGTITVNADKKKDNATSLVGGLCGANNGRIIHSYSTTTATAEVSLPVTAGGSTTNTDFNHAAGICKAGAYATAFAKETINSGNPRCAVVDCYAANNYVATPATQPDKTIIIGEVAGVAKFSTSAWPASTWVTYTGKWPVYSNDWKDPDNGNDTTGNEHPSTRSYWQSIGSSPSTYPTLLWERNY